MIREEHTPFSVFSSIGAENRFMIYSLLTEMIAIKLNERSKPVKCVKCRILVVKRIKLVGLMGSRHRVHGNLDHNTFYIGIQ